MSIKAMSWVLDHSQSTGSARLVLLVIADCANASGDIAWPGVNYIAEKAKVSRSTAQTALRSLASLGEIEVTPRYNEDGGQTSNLYRLTPGVQIPDPTPARDSGPPPPDPRAGPRPESGPKPELEPEIEPETALGRRCRLPQGFVPDDELLSWALTNFPQVDAVKETEQFADFHRGKGSTQLDWRATWRTWIRNAAKFSHSTTRSGKASNILGGRLRHAESEQR